MNNTALLRTLTVEELRRLERVLSATTPNAPIGDIDLAGIVGALRAHPVLPPLTVLPVSDEEEADPRVYELTLEGHTDDEAYRIAAEERAARQRAPSSKPEPRRHRRRRFQDTDHVEH